MSKYNLTDESFYLIPNEYVPILVNKQLFKKYEKAIKKVDDFQIPLYKIDGFENNGVKKPPNSFILFRKAVFKDVKINNPNRSSREISSIIGKMWKKMSNESKLSYQVNAKEIEENYKKLYPIHKYKKFLRNIKQREYIKYKESIMNISTINTLLFNEKFYFT